MDHQTEINYIKKILDGDTNLFSYFLNSYSHSVFTLIVRVVQSKEDAEELTQDTFLKAFRKLDTYRGDCSFSTWLFRIGYNTAISAVRKKKIVFPAIDEYVIDTVADEDVDRLLAGNDSEELLIHMEKAIEKLNPDEKALITLYYLENNPVQELAQVFGITPDNVKVKLHRTRKKLYVMIRELTKADA
ncbi:MAG: polymerase, sigma-24 subunit, subfamily [Bacteroidetes bacterium]|jgi:RNA polymerase sigma-70 factor (ECF subfamily)|nr:polymerase, sigma-24 subunit, subfamily [Bacteroidota bacterium]